MTRRTVVVLRALHLGDLLTAVPALRAVGDAFADHHRVLVTPEIYAPLVLGENLADQVVDGTELQAIDTSLAGPDVAIDLHGRGPGSQPLLLALQPKRLIAFRHPAVAETAGMPEWRTGEHEVLRWCRLLTESGIPADPRRIRLAAVPPAPGDPALTLIHPGAASEARRWPAARYAAVACAERSAGHRVLITGTGAERSLALEVAALAGLDNTSVVAGNTDLDALITLVAQAGRVISGDTGVAHLATAVGTPSVALFGPVPPSEWGPPDNGRHIALWAGRRGDPHATTLDEGLAAIGVIAVLSALEELERRRIRPPRSVVAVAAPAVSADADGNHPLPSKDSRRGHTVRA